MRNLNDLNQYRAIDWELRAVGAVGDANGGCFLIERNGVELRIMAASGGGWDHISVSTAERCPTWMEMEYVRKLFAKPNEVWLQFGVPSKDHINVHAHCLHWWRPLHREVRLPPSAMVA
jgi:hypothetical protein